MRCFFDTEFLMKICCFTEQAKVLLNDKSIAQFSESGNFTVEVDRIDDMIDEKVTYIKMDIEGFELKALEGAVKTIKKHRPKLAICLYHKHTDFLDIPNFILNLDLGYKLYVRHHKFYMGETVLYAV